MHRLTFDPGQRWVLLLVLDYFHPAWCQQQLDSNPQPWGGELSVVPLCNHQWQQQNIFVIYSLLCKQQWLNSISQAWHDEESVIPLCYHCATTDGISITSFILLLLVQATVAGLNPSTLA
jgi:hypothetical protein